MFMVIFLFFSLRLSQVLNTSDKFSTAPISFQQLRQVVKSSIKKIQTLWFQTWNSDFLIPSVIFITFYIIKSSLVYIP